MATITETQKINPNDLLVDLNVREDLRLDKALIASIKDLGVLQPIVATRTDEGLRVRYGHRDAWDHSPTRASAADLTPEQREVAKAARRLVIENNKAWTAAREVRRLWVKTYLTRKTLPAGAGNFIAHALTSDARLLHDHDANTIAAEWFGAEPATYGNSSDLVDVADRANDKRALVIALGTVLAAYEHDAGDRAWRQDGEHSPTGRYLRFLADLGYTLSPVEEYAISSETA